MRTSHPAPRLLSLLRLLRRSSPTGLSATLLIGIRSATLLIVSAALLAGPAAVAQQPIPSSSLALFSAADTTAILLRSGPDRATAAGKDLPDAPSAAPEPSSSLAAPQDAAPAQPAFHDRKAGRQYKKDASATDLVIFPGQIAPVQSVRDKLASSVLDSVSPFSLVGEGISASYSHLTNGSPNFGTNAPAFAQRFGAAVARNTSQKLFTEGAMASLLHEDARYYQMGEKGSVPRRVAYAITRPIISRTDSGRTTPNFALLGGYLGAAALTKVYYPPINQGFGQTLITFGGSLGGAAIGDVATEFFSNALQIVHLKKSN